MHVCKTCVTNFRKVRFLNQCILQGEKDYKGRDPLRCQAIQLLQLVFSYMVIHNYDYKGRDPLCQAIQLLQLVFSYTVVHNYIISLISLVSNAFFESMVIIQCHFQF